MKMLHVFSAALTGFLMLLPGLAYAGETLYVTNLGNNSISTVPAGGGTAIPFTTGFDSPESIAYSPNGNLYVSNKDGLIDSVSLNGIVTPFVQLPEASGPGALTADAAGNLYVALASSNAVDKITPAGSVSTYVTGVAEPEGLAFDASGHLFVVGYNGAIYKINVGGGGGMHPATTLYNDATGIAIEPSGNIDVTTYYFGDYAGEKFSPLWGVLGNLVVPDGGARAIAADSDGDIFIASSVYPSYDRIWEILPSGGTASLYATGLDGATSIALGPTPVPESDSLTLAGLVALSLLHRPRLSGSPVDGRFFPFSRFGVRGR